MKDRTPILNKSFFEKKTDSNEMKTSREIELIILKR
jgi:hypothetical protein